MEFKKKESISLYDFLKKEMTDEDIQFYWSDKNNDDCKDIASHSKKQRWFRCKMGHPDYLKIVNEFINKKCPCPICNKRKFVKKLNSMNITNPENIKFLVNKKDGFNTTSGNCLIKINVKCPQCGRISKITPQLLTQYKGDYICRNCKLDDGISFPEKIMWNLLKQLNIDFEREKILNGNKKYRYDFYLDKYNVLIEMDGGFHFYESKITSNTLEERQKIDKEKEYFAEKMGYKVVRIDCKKNNFEYIKENILQSKFFISLNLDDVNWEDCALKSMDNLALKACDLWNSGKTVKQIMQELNIGHKGVSNYLKKGNSSGICYYDGKEEDKKNLEKLHKKEYGIKTKIIINNEEYIFSSRSKAQIFLKDRGYDISISSICRYSKANKKVDDIIYGNL